MTGPAVAGAVDDPVETGAGRRTTRLGPGDPEAASDARARTGRRATAPLALAAGLYGVLAIALWWGAWSTHPSTTTTCACGDASLYYWFLEWQAYALAHGHNLFYSTLAFHPTGINLLSNTGVVGIGVLLAPVTWLFGPTASLNLASTLIPVLSALSMFWLLRRWVSWVPAAFVGGLLYGFSPFVLTGLTSGWLTTLIAVPPLMVACLDDLCAGGRSRPVRTGAILGLLAVVQFFISTELLAVAAITAAIGLVLVGAHAAVVHRAELARRARRVLLGLAVAAGVAGCALAYPIWFALAGPAHFSGLVWPSLRPGYYGLTASDFVRLQSTSAATLAFRRFGGYQGITLHESGYLGAGLLVVLAISLVLWRRDRRLWLFASVGLAAMALSLTDARSATTVWVPWRVLATIPVVQNILPVRFTSMVYLAVAVLLGLVVDHARTSILARGISRPGEGSQRALPRRRRATAAALALAVAAVALAPIASAYRGAFPLTMQPVTLPRWFATVAPRLPPGQVVLTYPAAFGGIQAPMAWQALDRMSFALVGGGGPGSVPQRAGSERPGFTVLAGATFSFGPVNEFPPSAVADVRRAVIGWGTTLVVIPDQPELPAYDTGSHTAAVVALMTAALGTPPHYQARAWVWPVTTAQPPALAVSPGVLAACAGSGNFPTGPVLAVPACVTSAARTTPGPRPGP